jgi:hypothetical protein
VAFVLKGTGIYPVVARLLNLLDGRRERDTIASGLPEKVRPLFSLLLSELGKRDFIVDRGEGGDAAPALEADFATAIAYLSDHGPGALPRFEAWRRRVLAVGGSGRIFDSLVAALLDLGAGDLYIFRDDGAEPSEAYREALSRARRRTAPQRVTELGKGDVPPVPVDATLYAADAIDEACLAAFAGADAPALVAGNLDGRVIVGPGPAAMPFAELKARLNREAVPAAAAAGQLALAGNLLAFEWFRIDCGVSPRGYSDRAKLVSAAMAVRDIPLDPARFAAQEKPVEHPERELTEFEALLERLKPLFDEATGVFATGSGETLHQLPLYHHEIVVRTDADAVDAATPVRAWGLGVEDAGRRAIARAAEHYVLGRLAATQEQPMVARAGFSPEEAKAQLALATAWLDEDLRAAATRSPIAFAEAEGEALVLWRLVQTMGPPDVRATRFEWAERPGAVVAIETGGGIVAWGAASDPHQALAEALGNRCSALQLKDGHAPDGEAASAAAFGDAWLDETTPLPAFGLHVACAARNPA